MNPSELERIASHFEFGGSFVEARRCNTGHINDTFIVTVEAPARPSRRYILQRINHYVFKSPEDVMSNIERVLQHLRGKVIASGGDPEREVVNLVPTRNGGYLYRGPEDAYWRSYLFVEGAQSYETVSDPVHFRSAGEAFGRFQSLLSDFPADSLIETIPRFHDTPNRLAELMDAVRRDAAGRAKDVRRDIAFVEERTQDVPIVVDLLEKGDLPLRVIHNDTKLNNVLIDDRTGKGICVLDLDTVMPGSALYDFGDAIRFGASTAVEDEPDTSKVGLDLELYREFVRGFLASAQDFLTPLELRLLPFSAKLIALELGMRFLADYLNGDIYFRIHRPNHNLDRARAQFRLALDIESKLDEMAAIVEEERVSDGRRYGLLQSAP